MSKTKISIKLYQLPGKTNMPYMLYYAKAVISEYDEDVSPVPYLRITMDIGSSTNPYVDSSRSFAEDRVNSEILHNLNMSNILGEKKSDSELESLFKVSKKWRMSK